MTASAILQSRGSALDDGLEMAARRVPELRSFREEAADDRTLVRSSGYSGAVS
jgi:hypothetical protein